jgi:hypothetical protein
LASCLKDGGFGNGLLHSFSPKDHTAHPAILLLLHPCVFPRNSLQKRRGGGIEPLHVSMPRELKSRPSTSPTHPGQQRYLNVAVASLRPCGHGVASAEVNENVCLCVLSVWACGTLPSGQMLYILESLPICGLPFGLSQQCFYAQRWPMQSQWQEEK